VSHGLITVVGSRKVRDMFGNRSDSWFCGVQVVQHKKMRTTSKKNWTGVEDQNEKGGQGQVVSPTNENVIRV